MSRRSPADNHPAQPRPVLRQDLLTAALDGGRRVDRLEVKRIELAPGQATGLHRHPCPVVGVITAGSVLFQVEGQPGKALRAGDAFFEPADTRILHFDNPSAGESATFTAIYLLKADDPGIIEMLD